MTGRATPDRVRWNDMDGRLMPTPPWVAQGMVVFRPDAGPFDVLVPEEEIEQEATRS